MSVLGMRMSILDIQMLSIQLNPGVWNSLVGDHMERNIEDP